MEVGFQNCSELNAPNQKPANHPLPMTLHYPVFDSAPAREPLKDVFAEIPILDDVVQLVADHIA